MSTTFTTDHETTASSSFHEPNDLAEEPFTEPTESSWSSGESSQETAHSGSFEWQESHTSETTETPETHAPITVAPTAAPSPTPNATVIPITNKSGSGGGSGAVVSVTLVIVGLLIVLGIFMFLRRRKRNNQFLAAKFHHDPNLGTPAVSIELPPPPPSARLSYDPSQSQLNHQQRLSVFSNGRPGGGSIFGTGAPVVSPNPPASRLQQPSQPSQFRGDQSMTYHLVDPTPSNVAATPMLQTAEVRTPTGSARPQHQPDYGQHKPQYNTKTSASTGDPTMMASSTTVSSSLQSQGGNGLVRDTTTSVASTIQGFHDSMCDDLYQYGDGLGRDRARSRSRGNSSATAPTTRPKKPSIVLEIDELMPLPVLTKPATGYSTPKGSKKTLSIAEMRAGGAGQRAPPPPPPPQPAVSSFFVMPPSSPTLSETDPFNPLMMTSVRVHAARASEDVVGNHAAPHAMTATFSSSASSAAASAGSASFDSDSSDTSAFSVGSSASSHLQSSHTGRIFEKPTDAAIQRLSDVSSVSSDTSSLRAGSLIELKQVVEVENPDGKAKEIEI